jgi:outer membrane murein-binding lipoprotein Lpp
MSGGAIAAIVIVIILVLVGVIVGGLYAAGVFDEKKVATISNQAVDNKIRTYKFYQGMDSPGNDIKQDVTNINNAQALKEYCDKLDGCVGFNTNGWLKSKIYDSSKFYRFAPETEKSMGLYVLDGYNLA